MAVSSLKNNKIIIFDTSYVFALVEEPDKEPSSPISDYYLKVSDLSVNLFITLKWIHWGYIFLKSLSEELKNLEDDYSLENLLSGGIQESKIFKFEKMDHILMIDDVVISDNVDFYKLVNESIYNESIVSENDKVHLKLKINLGEFVVISQVLFPTFLKFEKKTILKK